MAGSSFSSRRPQWVHMVISQHLDDKDVSGPVSGVPPVDGMPPSGRIQSALPKVLRDLSNQIPATVPDAPAELKVGIVGAGCAGLFTAMIFNYLSTKLSDLKGPPLNVKCEIFEAACEKRLGGRLYTYKFPRGTDHEYYDVGAMRFPEIQSMQRTFDLFDKLDMKKVDQLRPPPQNGSLIPYVYVSDQQPTDFNDIQYFGKVPDENPYKITDVPEKFLKLGPGAVLGEAIKPLSREIQKDPKKGWDLLMRWADQFSTRQYLASTDEYHYEDNDTNITIKCPGYNYNTIEWLETFNSGERWFDQALSETVLEDANFSGLQTWRCIQGGAQQVARRMLDKLLGSDQKPVIHFDSPVTALGIDEETKRVDLTVAGTRYEYDAIFNSLPLGCMRRIDTRRLPLTYGTKQAIRSLNYGASSKVAMRFKTLWWIADPAMKINGGLGKTDLPLRVCVYPSYNLEDPVDKPGVLLCSYTWGQDADRMGGLIKPHSPKCEDSLRDLLFHNLALLHSKTKDPSDYDRVYKIISDNYITHHAFNWNENEFSTGAFAWFGPGQFKSMYPEIIQPDGRHIMIGELASAHHAWIVGALESAVRGVYQFLHRRALLYRDEACIAAMELYHKGEVASPYGPLPAEFTETTWGKDGKEATADVGALARKLVELEMVRLESEKQQSAK